MPECDGELSGRVAVVTGAGMGMGEAIAHTLAAAGAHVAAFDVNTEAGESVVEAITAAGCAAHFGRVDVSDSAQVRTAIDDVMDRYGRLDIAVNNAAIAPDDKPTAEFDEDYWDRLIAVDLTGVALCMKYEIRAMLAAGNGGSIVNLSSIRGFRPGVGKIAYTAAKHGVNGVTKVAAMEYGESGIRVNAVAPGAVETPMLRATLESRGDDISQYTKSSSLLGRLGAPQDIADACLWLASDRSSYVTGTTIHVDAGLAQAR